MRKSSKWLCALLAAIMLLSIVSAPVKTANADTEATNSGVAVRLESFLKEYPDGLSWKKSFDGGSQCYGFAKLVIYSVFGKYDSKKYRSWTTGLGTLTGMKIVGKKLAKGFSDADLYALLAKAKPGDVVQCAGGSRCLHSMVIYSIDASNKKDPSKNVLTIYDCNWDHKCGIQLREYTFSKFYSHVCERGKLGLLRASNYDKINKTPFISLDAKKAMGNGCSITLNAKAAPKSIVEPGMVWTSSDTSVATVNAKGKVSAKKVGTTTIKVQTLDGKYKASCVVTVKDVATLPSITATGSLDKVKVTVKWGAATKAAKYSLQRREPGGNWKTIATVTGKSYTDKAVKAGKTYEYRVKAGINYSYKVKAGTVKTIVWGAFCTSSPVTLLPAAPTVTVKATKGAVTATWNAVIGATKYCLYRKQGSDNWVVINVNLTGTNYIDRTVKAGKTYQYTVRAYNAAGWGSFKASTSIKAK